MENQVRLKLNESYQWLAYAHDVNLLGDNTDTVTKNTETLDDASKEVHSALVRINEELLERKVVAPV
jgi:hypothetical protein